MADKTKMAKVKKVDGRTTRRSDTYRDLEGYLANVTPDSDGQWPAEMMWTYDHAPAGDVMAWRIRHGKMKLPSLDGGTAGKWGAKVERVKLGRENVNGPCRVWVWYEGGEK